MSNVYKLRSKLAPPLKFAPSFYFESYMFKRLIGDQWMDEVTRGQGGLLELWGSLEDTHRGHSTPEKGEEIGFFQKCRGQLGTDLGPCICPKSSSRVNSGQGGRIGKGSIRGSGSRILRYWSRGFPSQCLS